MCPDNVPKSYLHGFSYSNEWLYNKYPGWIRIYHRDVKFHPFQGIFTLYGLHTLPPALDRSAVRHLQPTLLYGYKLWPTLLEMRSSVRNYYDWHGWWLDALAGEIGGWGDGLEVWKVEVERGAREGEKRWELGCRCWMKASKLERWFMMEAVW